ncbi:uncharacterized protein LOC6561793 [Drosophila grimshawi]|uniref:GH11721 n=1 Tax=Drosophila grimshawi TaxID=7222 RepID=B4JD54_DROGR|nr:uncharacterized protein LOC6561793 [Drosophila grimshawi]EDW04298.1 GH11721 [Drosophila grimshawi]
MDAQFEHLCRICAANTKCKNNSVVESVFIFKTNGLKDKIARHLFLNVAEEDPLPKVLCKSCYRQVEATASLSNIAKHTQQVFRDFLLSTVPKYARQATEALHNESPVATASTQDISESNNSNRNNNAKRYYSNLDNNETFHPILLTRPPESSVAPSLQQKHDDVVISWTNKDIELRQQQQKQQRKQPTAATTDHTSNRSSIKMNNLMIPARRSSVFVDTRYSSAPMSIAQRSMQLPPSLAPIHPDVSLSKVTKKCNEKRNSPAGVINFIQTHGRITGSAPIISNTGINKGHHDEHTNKVMHIRKPMAVAASSASASQTIISAAGVPNLPRSVLQQKRRNLKNALNNISAIRDGQVSLLKSSHLQRPITEDINYRPLVTTTVVPHQSLYGVEPSVEEALPEHIIIAAPKKKKEEPASLSSSDPPKLQKIAKLVRASYASDGGCPPIGEAMPASKSKTPPSISSLTDAISLGNVIRDPDLLKLILKALKWPVTTGNCEEQMARLKNSKFAVIMSDSNLLQDTDLTQLLGPYLGPMMAVVQQQQKQSSAIATTKSPSPPASPSQEIGDTQTLGDCAMPYKLPPETSVQLVPSSPTDLEQHQPVTIKPVEPIAKLSQRKSRLDDLYLDGQATTAATTSNAALVTNELLNINAMLISQFGTNPADALNEALISMLRQQQESKNQRSSRRRRSASTTSTCLNLEDIVLVEPQLSVPGSDVSTLTMPPQELYEPPPPPITRPIIKRRKVVVQALKQSCAKNTHIIELSMPKTDTDKDASKSEPERLKVPEETSSNANCHKILEASTSQQAVETPQAPTSTVPEMIPSSRHKAEPECATDYKAAVNNNPTEPSLASVVRRSNVKSALGQKLLEAIGLPQLGKNVPTESSRDTLRSALKRSLKQAQEQQQQLKRVKQEEPVKQMADSTTKPVAGESSEEHKKAIAERELELLKRKTKNAETTTLSFKDEKTERTDVSSSSSRNRRNRKKSKTDANEDDSFIDERKSERWDEDDDLPLKTELEKNSEHFNRPTRTSKTMSKYYKSPGSEKALLSTQKSQHAMGRRSTRQR